MPKMQDKTSSTTRYSFNIGTLNVRGLNSESKKIQLANDMAKYQLTAMAIQETKLKKEGVIEINTSNNRKSYEIYHTGSEDNKHYGVGIVTEKGLDVEFKTVSNRTCTATIKLKGKDKKIVIISTYAPTLEISEKTPKGKEDYYEEFESVLNKISKRDICIIGRNMNAKTGLGHKDFPEVIGRYGKGEMNSNGRSLAEMLIRNDMILGNTMFKHKMAHRTTWEGPQRKNPHIQNPQGEIHTETRLTIL